MAKFKEKIELVWIVMRAIYYNMKVEILRNSVFDDECYLINSIHSFIRIKRKWIKKQ